MKILCYCVDMGSSGTGLAQARMMTGSRFFYCDLRHVGESARPAGVRIVREQHY
jgi:hypothetical protein